MSLKRFRLFVIGVSCLVMYYFWSNHTLTVTHHQIQLEKLPEALDGIKIVQLSDLHDASFGSNQKRLIQKVNGLSPDLVVHTGDFVDSKRWTLEENLAVIRGIEAPQFYVTGNHEAWSARLDEVVAALEQEGVHVLRNEGIRLPLRGEALQIFGMDDPAVGEQSKQLVASEMQSLDVSILLAHRPEAIESYRKLPVDIVFSGHAHGGQFRLPFIGGLVAPDQGFFPKWTAGMHEENEQYFVISRGLGNSIIPMRVGNRPEIVEVTLNKKHGQSLEK
ncbi:MAG TPA: metallophosphoesterase [Savagea sp.]